MLINQHIIEQMFQDITNGKDPMEAAKDAVLNDLFVAVDVSQ